MKTNHAENLDARKLIHTATGQKWLGQFQPLDQEAAIVLANSLTLVSHNEFNRNMQKLVEEVSSRFSGKVALFAIRELEKEAPLPQCNAQVLPFYTQAIKDGNNVSAVSASSDQGSEAIIAHFIRQICKANPEKFLNHPSLELLRSERCDALIFVDDFIGSGGRVLDFLQSFWLERSIISWRSSKHIEIEVVAYSGTEDGVRAVQRHKSGPFVNLHIDAPTFHSLPIGVEKRAAVLELCDKYGKIALKSRKHMWRGFKSGMASMIFEHGCPNNTPAILWDPDERNGTWLGLFPNRTVDSETASVFPPEIVRGDTIALLRDIGQERLAVSGSLLRRGEAGQLILLVLALLSQGQRKRAAICFATGLSSIECEKIVSKCIKWRFVTPQRRITASGLAELKAARKSPNSIKGFLDVGSEYYYPTQLREAT